MIKGYLELFDYLCEKFSTMGNEVGVVSIPKIAKDTNTNASDITKHIEGVGLGCECISRGYRLVRVSSYTEWMDINR